LTEKHHGLLMLAAGPGTPLKIVADGADEAQVITALDDLLRAVR